jgi:LacI family transcriptional regulator
MAAKAGSGGTARRGRAAKAATPPARATINDIARLARVSKKTVSRVINQSPFVRQETRERIAALMREFSYVPDPQARGLAFRRSFLIGLVFDNPNASYIVDVQNGALDAMRDSGFELAVHPCDRRSAGFVDDVRRFAQQQKLAGVIVLSPVSENPQLADALDELGCRYVRIASVDLEDPGRMLVANDRDAAAEVATYLASLGHRLIAFVAGPATFRSAHERKTGFAAALKKRGIALKPEYIVEGGYTFESGVACAERLLALKTRPTAIFACNDEMAAGIYRVAYRLGLSIPEDLSVVGFDDSPLASRLWPSLTTVHSPVRDMGRRAAAMLLDSAGGSSAPDEGQAIFTPHLVIRDSAQAPR